MEIITPVAVGDGAADFLTFLPTNSGVTNG